MVSLRDRYNAFRARGAQRGAAIAVRAVSLRNRAAAAVQRTAPFRAATQFFERHPRTTQAVGKALHPSSLIRVAATPLFATGSAFSGAASKAGLGLKNIYHRATANPFATGTLKQVAKSFAGKAAGLYLAGTGFELVRSAQAGDPFQPLGIKTIQTATGFALGGPIFGAGGALIGLGQQAFRKTKAYRYCQQIL